MPNFTLANLPERYHAEIQQQLGHAAYYPTPSGVGTHNVLQKLKDAPSRKGGKACDADNQSDETETDGELHPKYRFAVTLNVSDNRARDADGALSSLLDATIHAVGRLNPMDSRDNRKRKARAKG